MLKLVERPLPLQLLFVKETFVDVQLTVGGDAEVDIHSRDQGDSVRFLLEGLVVDSEGSDRVEVDRDRGDLHVSEVEGLGELLYLSVFREEAAAVKVVPLPRAAL